MYDWVWTWVPLVTYKPQGVKQVSGPDKGISYFTKNFCFDRWNMNINWHTCKCIILLGFCLIQALVKWYVLMPFYICRPQIFGWKIALKRVIFIVIVKLKESSYFYHIFISTLKAMRLKLFKQKLKILHWLISWFNHI